MADFVSDIKKQIESKLRLHEAKRRNQLIAAGALAFAALWPLVKPLKPGQKRKKFDPAGAISLFALASLIFSDSNNEKDPTILAYKECKKKNPDQICRARYVVDSIKDLIPDFGA